MTETATFQTRAEAREWARKVEQAMYTGQWNRRGRDGGSTVSWILDRYLAATYPSRDTRRQLEWWRAQLGNEFASSLTRDRILRLRRRLIEEKSKSGRKRGSATVNRYVAALSGLFTWAVRQDHLEVHPIQGISALPEDPVPLRCLSREERRALIAACGETGGLRLQALVVLGLSTGARRGEILRLRWSDLDVPERQVKIRGSGRLRSRTLPIPASVMALLGKLTKVRRIDVDWIFADAHGEARFPRAAWEAALETAEIEDFRFHDLRHSAAAYLAKNGATLAEIAHVLGTRTLQGVRRYAPLTRSQAPAVIGRMHEDLFET